MIYWYLQDPNRFKAEQEALRAVEREVTWLTVTSTRLDDQLQVCVDVEIAARGETFAATLRYPQTFPFTAPSVFPQVAARWSAHQYGTGELCLEWGPDNWLPELTGAEMIRSAERLLSGEARIGKGQTGVVPSRHETTTGQDLRARWGRLVVTHSLVDHLAQAPIALTSKAQFLAMDRDETYVVTPFSVGRAEGEPWVDPEVPDALTKLATIWTGLVFRLPADVILPSFAKGSELKEFLAGHGYAPPADFTFEGIELVLVWTESGARLMWFLRDEDTVYRLPTVESAGGQRLDVAHGKLAGKTVGVVGCGSAGAKIAVSLARSGVPSFLLIDDDVLLPENLVRQELDWTAVGEHKVNGLARRLSLAAPGTRSQVRQPRLGGQEANGSVDWTLTRLQECDLIIDATANPAVFNLLSSVVQAAEKPLVWLEIFAGGIGGLIARSRPGVDPAPQTIRGRINAWCADQGIAAPRPTQVYGAETSAGPLIADDADVAVIAAHAARYCIDLLVEKSPSAFPASAYLIGLSQAWVFSQPFHTIPLDVGDAEDAAAPEAVDSAAVEAVLQLFKDRRDQASTAS